MDHETLLHTLADMGMDRLSRRAVAALPLVQVAWADGKIQPEEQALILRVAEEQFMMGEEGALLLQDWLRHAPSPAYFAKGREVLRALVLANTGDFDGAVLADLEALVQRVAKASGGLFGFSTVSRAEAVTIEEIVASLRRPLAHGDLDQASTHRGRMTMLSEAEDEDDEPEMIGVIITQDASGRRKHRVRSSGMVIGSGDAADLRVVAPKVAPVHCKIVPRRRRYYVEDHSGALGTRVRNGDLDEAVGFRRLLGGETLVLGDVTVVFKMARAKG